MAPFDIIGYPLVALALVEIALGVALLRRGVADGVHRAAGIFVLVVGLDSLAAGLVYAAASPGEVDGLLYRFTWFAWLTVPAGLHLLGAVHGAPPRWARLVVAGLYLFWTAVLVLVVATDWIERPPASLLPFVDRIGPLEDAVRMVGSLMGALVTALILLFHRRARGHDRLQLSYFLLGALLFAIGGTINSVLPPLVGHPPLDPALASYFTPPTVVLIFLAVTRRRLPDAPTLLSRALGIIALLVPLGAVHTAIFLALEELLAPVGAVVVAFAATAALLLATPVRAWLRGTAEVLVRRQRDRDRHHAVMREAARAVVTLLSPDDLIAHLASVVRRGLEATSVAVYVVEEDGRPALRHAHGGPPGGFPETIAAPLVAAARAAAAAPVPLDALPPLDDPAPLPAGADDMLLVPLQYQDVLQGLVLVGPRPDGAPYVGEDFEVLETLGYQAAIALANARLYHEATTDDLTGLYHRKYFLRRLAEEIERARLAGRSIGVLMVDADRFKSVNDTFGHAVGDRVLAGLARTLQTALRHPDTAARMGGEEFAVLLCDVNAASACGVAERIRRTVEEAHYARDAAVTISVGVAVHTPAERAAAVGDILSAADSALYEAKRAGRNRVRLHDVHPGAARDRRRARTSPTPTS